MNDRDCENCAHHTGGSCSVWECSFEQKEDDTISRRATIVALCGECQGNCIPCEHFPCEEIKVVQALPHAQPEVRTQMSSADCISRQAAIESVFKDDRNTTIKQRLEALPSARPEPQWIPCSKTIDIPDHEVLCCDRHGEELIGWLSYNDDQWLCESDGEMMYDPIAWREKPEPYREEGEVDDIN